MPKKREEIGNKYGKLTVIAEAPPVNRHRMVVAVCECGEEGSYYVTNLRASLTTSCGCLVFVHGKTKTLQYKVWQGMKGRCDNPSHVDYHNYGARGIEVCPRWKDKDNGFTNFMEDMGERPTPSSTIERLDVNKGYYPENCVWLERKYQSGNRRNTYLWEISVDGEITTHSLPSLKAIGGEKGSLIVSRVSVAKVRKQGRGATCDIVKKWWKEVFGQDVDVFLCEK